MIEIEARGPDLPNKPKTQNTEPNQFVLEGVALLEELKKLPIQRRLKFSEQLVEGEYIARARHKLLFFAERTHREYQHYKGHWDTWVLGRTLHKILVKTGICAEQGDFVLVQKEANIRESNHGFKWFVTVFSCRRVSDCMISIEDIEII